MINIRMRFRKFAYVAAVALPLIASGQAANAQQQDSLNLSITGAGVQGYYKLVYEAMNGIVRDVYPGSAITFKPSSPAGGVMAIAKGESDLSLAAGAPEIQYAVEGKPPYPSKMENIRGVMRIHNTQLFHFLMNKQAADRYGVHSFADIAEKKPPLTIAINRKGNLQIVEIAKDIMEAHGFTIEDLESWGGSVSWVASETALDQLQDRKADMFFNVRFAPDARVKEIAHSVDLVWVEADREALQQVADKWGYETSMIEESTYPELLSSDQLTLAQWSVMLAGAHVPEKQVYNFLKALVENQERVQAIHPSMSGFTAKEAAEITQLKGVPLHPGAERFYRERGMLTEQVSKKN
ncbi:TAXI family TRAP transporter solute-binding subunit [Pseudomonas wenzhouensis]|nr:TAXI family TRAP transporter solute-binding subunit [Pseudomonas wenzhouensis]MDM9653245.1 TAXI family TRAP transporter solute-binding subunit [Pseudomonas wenzhouensis]